MSARISVQEPQIISIKKNVSDVEFEAQQHKRDLESLGIVREYKRDAR
jgi:hypothetical protein